MKVSIILPTHNGAKYLPAFIGSFKSQTLKAELIIVDSSSTDNTVCIAKNFGIKVISIPVENFDHGGTRTYMAKKIVSDILVFMTQDALFYDNYSLERLVSCFSDKKIAAAYGRQMPYENETLFGSHLRLFNYPDSSYIRSYDDRFKYGIKTPFLSNSFAAYRRDKLKSVGWFKSKIILGEDFYVGAKLLKAGFKIAYIADAKVYHSHNYTIIEEFKRYFDIGVFHKQEKWILDEFGMVSSEGKRYLLSEINYICRHRKIYLLPLSILRIFAKLIGYKAGKYYNLIPYKILKYFTMHRSWWH